MSQISSLENGPVSISAPPPPKPTPVQQPKELPTPAFIPTAQTVARTPPPVEEPDAEHPGFVDAFNAAKGDTPTLLFYQQAQRSGFEPDPNFQLTDKMLNDRSEGIDLDLIPLYGGAVSEDQLDAMYSQNLARMDRRKTLQQAGMTSVPASILAELSDPIGLLVGALSGGGSVAVNATRAARAASAVKAGLVGASAFGSLESYRASQNPAISTTDVLIAAASGGLFGAAVHATSGMGGLSRAMAGGAGSAAPVVAFGAFRDDQDAKDVAIGASTAFLMGAFGGSMSKPTREALDPVLWRLSKDVHSSEIDPATVTPKGLEYFAEQHSAERVNARTEAALHAIAPDAAEHQAAIDTVAAQSAAPSEATPSISVGAATQAEISRASPYGDRYDIDLRPDDFRTASIATDSRRQGLHLNDMGSMVSKSEIPTIRKIGNTIFGDYVPKQDGKTFYTGDYFTADRQRAIMGPYSRVVDAAYREMRAAGFTGSDEELGRSVFRAVVGGIPSDTPEAIARIARKTASDFGTLLEVMQRHGVRGALDVPHDKSYMPHSWLRDMLDRKTAQHGQGPLVDFLSKAVEPHYPELTPEQHHAIAESIVKNAGKPRKSQFISADAFDGVSESLREAGFSPEMIADVEARMETRLASGSDRGKLAQLQQTSDPAERAAIKASLEKSASDTGNPSNLKHRIQLQETYEQTMADGTSLSVMDLLETDPRALMNTYSKRAYGNSVLAQVLKHSENPNAPVKPVVSIDDLLNRLRNEAKLAGRADLEEGNILRIEAGLKNVVGIPIEDLSSPTKQRIVRAINVSKQLMAAKMLSGIATGIQNITEPLSAVPVLGMRAVFKAFPSLFEMRKAAIDGTLTNHDLALAEHLTGAGADSANQGIVRRPHGPAITTIDRVLSYLEPKIDKAGEFASKFSGMQWGNEAGEKLIGASQIRRWGQWAESGKRPPEWAIKTTTLAPAMVDRVLTQIRDHSTNDVNPATGVRQKNLNWFDWKDDEAASAFRDSIALEGRRLFLRGNKNELQKWMGTSVGSMFIQFRGFKFQATRAKLAYGLSTKDALHGASMLTNMGLAAAGYMLTSYAKSLLLPAGEREKYIADNLSLKAIGLASISQASWTSMLTPAVDTAATTLGFDPVFSFARTSGIQGTAPLGFDSFPVGAQAHDMLNATKSLVQPWVSSDYSFSQADLRNIQRAFLPRVLQQTQFLDIMGRSVGLPEKSKD